jgi:meiotically up-regulated gene 157 (Mug157) protein
MQALKTITQTQTTQVESVHADTVYAVLENAYNNLQLMDADCTGASMFINSANIYAQLADLYASFASTDDYVALSSVMEIFANNITYYDESSLYDDCVKNTAMQNVNLLDYAYLSN